MGTVELFVWAWGPVIAFLVIVIVTLECLDRREDRAAERAERAAAVRAHLDRLPYVPVDTLGVYDQALDPMPTGLVERSQAVARDAMRGAR